VSRRIKKVLIGVCLTVSLLGQKADIQATAPPEPVAPEAPIDGPRAAPLAPRKPQSVRAVRILPKAASFGLLLAACLCLVALELKLHRRKTDDEGRLAETLAGALRAGVLGLDQPVSAPVPVWRIWDEPRVPAAPPESGQMLSRYRLLGYSGESSDDPFAARVVSIRILGVEVDPFAPVSEISSALRWTGPQRALAEPATGDDPREGIPDLDLAEPGS
jgi:hypothetical protein